eukprot:11850409-Ditylum_brightwellii.AAC.1
MNIWWDDMWNYWLVRNFVPHPPLWYEYEDGGFHSSGKPGWSSRIILGPCCPSILGGIPMVGTMVSPLKVVVMIVLVVNQVNFDTGMHLQKYWPAPAMHTIAHLRFGEMGML